MGTYCSKLSVLYYPSLAIDIIVSSWKNFMENRHILSRKYYMYTLLLTVVSFFTKKYDIFRAIKSKSIKNIAEAAVYIIIFQYAIHLNSKELKSDLLRVESYSNKYMMKMILNMPGIYRKKYINDTRSDMEMITINNKEYSPLQVGINKTKLMVSIYETINMLSEIISLATICMISNEKKILLMAFIATFLHKKYISPFGRLDSYASELEEETRKSKYHGYMYSLNKFAINENDVNIIEDKSLDKCLKVINKPNMNKYVVYSSIVYSGYGIENFISELINNHDIFRISSRIITLANRIYKSYEENKDINILIKCIPQINHVDKIKINKLFTVSNINFEYASGTPFRLHQDKELTFKLGDIIHVTGNNAHGKTTFYNIIKGYAVKNGDPEIKKCEYKLIVDGKEVEEFRCINSYMIEQISVLPRGEIKKMFYGPRTKEMLNYKDGMITEIMKVVGLGEIYGNNDNEILSYDVKEINGGNMQRLKLAYSIFTIKMCNPQIVIFDEPNTYIDNTFDEIIKNIFKFIDCSGKIVFITCHNHNNLGNRRIHIDNGDIKSCAE